MTSHFNEFCVSLSHGIVSTRHFQVFAAYISFCCYSPVHPIAIDSFYAIYMVAEISGLMERMMQECKLVALRLATLGRAKIIDVLEISSVS